MLPILLSAALSAVGVIIESIERNYQVQDGLISVVVTAKLRNAGPASPSAFVYSLTPREAEHIGLVTASLVRSSARQFADSLPLIRDRRQITIRFPKSFAIDTVTTVYISYTLGNYLLFVKPTIRLNERIGAFFNTSAFYHGEYPVQQSVVLFNGVVSGAITKYSPLPGVTVRHSQSISLTLTDVIDDDLEVEFVTSRPLPYIAEIRAKTYVSHWGKSKQSAFYEVWNAGPKFVGEFNRIDFTPRSPCYLQRVPLTPPPGAYDFWGRDEAGQLERTLPTVGDEVYVPLRGPMLSSWKATFTAGWTVNTRAFVSGIFTLSTYLLTPTFPAPIGSVVADFVLPEGAQITTVHIPIEANTSQYTELGNLDWRGRSVFRVETGPLASTDLIPVVIEYSLSASQNFAKMLALSVVFALLFVAIVLGRRIDLSIPGSTVASAEKVKDE
jgi:hypothetical protein